MSSMETVSQNLTGKPDIILTWITSLFLGVLIVILVQSLLEKDDVEQVEVIDATPLTVSDDSTPATV